MCIPPRASANVLGTVNAIASAIVVYFMAISFACEIGDDRTLTTKIFFRRDGSNRIGDLDQLAVRCFRGGIGADSGEFHARIESG
jgi:hypothetical protein